MTLKSVLVTGCSVGGIGFALVEAFQKRNLHVFASARNLSTMSQLEELPNVTLLPLDPTSAVSVQTAVESVRAQTGGTLDYLMNNAGQTIIMPTLDFDIETATKIRQRYPRQHKLYLYQRNYTLDGVTGIYAGSKAAMTAITVALRLELAPFGVGVVTVNTGAVNTNTLASGANFKLPAGSVYKSIKKEIAGRARGEDGTPRMEPSVYAEKVVGDVLGGARGQIWRGGYASIVRFALSKLPISLSLSQS
ncbi:hypothetical protein IMSHALPRED_004685 [Imshaugia aleurites]|uniref:Uncharacterized protein n=1 Tax=Imshaugia aleurites TaxID=172621 RepID=A0A8H3F6T0_9LECA|nr:hypothetical protein IMSHALPRED_004685 [Imshaugia aleurites]